MTTLLRPAVVMLFVLTVATGIVYPLLVTGAAQIAFPGQAGGSLVSRNGQVVGSSLIGQPFSGASYFWSRPSATSPMPDNAASSGGSNLGPTNPALVDAVKDRVAALRAANGTGDTTLVPADLVTASGSGLDPDISVEAALYQVARVARERHLPVDKVRALVDAHTQPPELGFLGEARVNVLLLNLALDELAPSS